MASPAPVHMYAHFHALETVDEEAKFKGTLKRRKTWSRLWCALSDIWQKDITHEAKNTPPNQNVAIIKHSYYLLTDFLYKSLSWGARAVAR